jgi:hypothetical protein
MEKKSDRWNSAIAVKISEVSESDKGPFVTPAEVVTENSADLSTRMMGYVTKVYVQIGTKVSGTNIGKYQ